MVLGASGSALFMRVEPSWLTLMSYKKVPSIYNPYNINVPWSSSLWVIQIYMTWMGQLS